MHSVDIISGSCTLGLGDNAFLLLTPLLRFRDTKLVQANSRGGLYTKCIFATCKSLRIKLQKVSVATPTNILV